MAFKGMLLDLVGQNALPRGKRRKTVGPRLEARLQIDVAALSEQNKRKFARCIEQFPDRESGLPEELLQCTKGHSR